MRRLLILFILNFLFLYGCQRNDNNQNKTVIIDGQTYTYQDIKEKVDFYFLKEDPRYDKFVKYKKDQKLVCFVVGVDSHGLELFNQEYSSLLLFTNLTNTPPCMMPPPEPARLLFVYSFNPKRGVFKYQKMRDVFFDKKTDEEIIAYFDRNSEGFVSYGANDYLETSSVLSPLDESKFNAGYYIDEVITKEFSIDIASSLLLRFYPDLLEDPVLKHYDILLKAIYSDELESGLPIDEIKPKLTKKLFELFKAQESE